MSPDDLVGHDSVSSRGGDGRFGCLAFCIVMFSGFLISYGSATDAVRHMPTGPDVLEALQRDGAFMDRLCVYMAVTAGIACVLAVAVNWATAFVRNRHRRG